MSAPVKLSSFLLPALRGLPPFRDKELLLVGSFWQTVAGPDLARHCVIEDLLDGIVGVRANGPAWVRTLRSYETRIVGELSRHSGVPVRGLAVREGQVPTEPAGGARRRPSILPRDAAAIGSPPDPATLIPSATPDSVRQALESMLLAYTACASRP